MKYSFVFFVFLFSALSNAETLWSNYSVTFLKGNNYEVGDSNRNVLTFEYVSRTSWGDNFLFIDRIKSDNNDLETYGEWSPRIKLKSFDKNFIKSVYLAGTLEMGSFTGVNNFGKGFNNYLLGVGADVTIPNFDFFKVNLYHRNNDNGDNSYQMTFIWGVPVKALYYDGFLDYATSKDNASASINFTSQLKYDLSKPLELSSKLYVGIEYTYWHNKFGISGINENNINLLIKYHF